MPNRSARLRPFRDIAFARRVYRLQGYISASLPPKHVDSTSVMSYASTRLALWNEVFAKAESLAIESPIRALLVFENLEIPDGMKIWWKVRKAIFYAICSFMLKKFAGGGSPRGLGEAGVGFSNGDGENVDTRESHRCREGIGA